MEELVFGDLDVNALQADSTFVRSSHCRPDRGWTPSFNQLVDRGETRFRFSAAGHTIVVDQEHRRNGTGSAVWDGSLVMMGYIETLPPDYFRGRRVLELGSGTGVSGLLVSLLRPSEVVITDLPQCLPLIQRNVAEMAQVAAAEGASVSPISVEPCAWGEPLSFANARFDVILGTDLLYAPELVDPLAATLHDLMAAADDRAEILFAFEERMDIRLFYAAMARRGFEGRETPLEWHHPRWRAPEIHICRFVRVAAAH